MGYAVYEVALVGIYCFVVASLYIFELLNTANPREMHVASVAVEVRTAEPI